MAKRLSIEARTEEEKALIKAFQIETRVRDEHIKDVVIKWIKRYLARKRA